MNEVEIVNEGSHRSCYVVLKKKDKLRKERDELCCVAVRIGVCEKTRENIRIRGKAQLNRACVPTTPHHTTPPQQHNMCNKREKQTVPPLTRD